MGGGAVPLILAAVVAVAAIPSRSSTVRRLQVIGLVLVAWIVAGLLILN